MRSKKGRGVLGWWVVCLGILCAGCAPKTSPVDLFTLAPESTAHRAMQTRQFETSGSDVLLAASAAVLQDLGFQITETDRTLGFLRAAKERSAREYGQEITRQLVALLTAAVSGLGQTNAVVLQPVDLHQQICASMVAQPLHDDDERQQVRIVFYRLVWKGEGQNGNQRIAPGEQKMEMLRDAELYQQFYAALSKAVFLEAHKI